MSSDDLIEELDLNNSDIKSIFCVEDRLKRLENKLDWFMQEHRYSMDKNLESLDINISS